MIITERDRAVINYIDKVKYATTKNIADLFFDNGSKNYYIVALRRLKQLVSFGKIFCFSANINNIGRPMTVYFTDKPVNKNKFKHVVAMANFSAELKKNNVDIVSVEPEVCYGSKIRADALYKVVYNNKKRLFIAEFDITKKFNTTKYEYFKKSNEWVDYFNKFPRVVSISDRKPSPSKSVNIIHVNSNFENINTLLELIQ